MSDRYTSLSSFYDAKTKTFVTFTLVLIGLLFVWSNNSDGANVQMILNVNLLGKVGNLIDNYFAKHPYNKEVFSFTLLSSVKDFWSSKSYGLSIIIAAFSGFWPYIKLILLMITWLQPMPEMTRSQILFVLDQFGKFSLVDLYVCVYMIVSFYFDINESFTNVGDVNVQVIVNPKLGMTTFVVGTLASVFVNHFLIWLDETSKYVQSGKGRVGDHPMAPPGERSGGPLLGSSSRPNDVGEADMHGSSAVLIPTDISEDRLKEVNNLFFRLPSKSKSGVLFRGVMMVWMLFITWATLQAALSAPVRFKTGGLAGAFASDPTRAYNLVDVISKVSKRTQVPHTAVFLDIVFTATLVVFPALVCLLCIMIWFVPMSGYACRFLGVFVLPFNSLAAIEVFWMAGIAASLELNKVSRWIIDQNKSFQGVCSTIETITRLDCFSVTGTLLDGCWWMLVAGFGLWSVVWYTRYSLNVAFGPNKSERYDPVHEGVGLGVEY